MSQKNEYIIDSRISGRIKVLLENQHRLETHQVIGFLQRTQKLQRLSNRREQQRFLEMKPICNPQIKHKKLEKINFVPKNELKYPKQQLGSEKFSRSKLRGK